jgi:hypothetical protein
MQRVTMSVHLRGTATPPAGEPPQTDPRARSDAIVTLAADVSDPGITLLTYENHAVFTGETTFVEQGTIRVNGGEAELDVASVGDGTMAPSPDPELYHGAVLWRVVEGRGRLAGATGLITSNFLLQPALGEFDEFQVITLFLP